MSTKPKILIVDDEEKIGKLFKAFLFEDGFEADYVMSGKDAIEKIKTGEFNLVFLDIVMPGLNGVQTLQRIKEINSEIKVVMISGYSMPELLDKARSMGIHSFLNKPINLNILKDVVMSAMDGAPAPEDSRKRCIVIDEKKNFETAALAILNEAGFVVDLLGSFDMLRDQGKLKDYDLIVLNTDPDKVENFTLLSSVGKKVLVILDNSNEEELMEKALMGGAACYLQRSSIKKDLFQIVNDEK